MGKTVNKANLGGGRRPRDPPGGDLVLCKRSLSSSQGTILMAAKLGKEHCGGRGHDLYSSSVSWPLAEVLSVRKGTLGYRSGSNCPGGLTRRWMDRAFKGTRAKFNATFRENCPLLTPAQFGFRVQLLEILSVQPLAQSHLSPLLGRQGPSLSIYSSLLRSVSSSHWRGSLGPE